MLITYIDYLVSWNKLYRLLLLSPNHHFNLIFKDTKSYSDWKEKLLVSCYRYYLIWFTNMNMVLSVHVMVLTSASLSSWYKT